jgi:hypothetical protein
MTCLICRYYQPAEPPQHKADREAGQCQSACGKKWNQFTAINYVKSHGSLDGWCRLHPEAKRYAYNHVCGDISVCSYFLNSGWGVEPFEARDNLFEWAQEALGTVLHGTWNRQRSEELVEQNTELRRQLKRTREISASRLKRLQKIENKPTSKPEHSVEEPFYPRLIAAE